VRVGLDVAGAAPSAIGPAPATAGAVSEVLPAPPPVRVVPAVVAPASAFIGGRRGLALIPIGCSPDRGGRCGPLHSHRARSRAESQPLAPIWHRTSSLRSAHPPPTRRRAKASPAKAGAIPIGAGMALDGTLRRSQSWGRIRSRAFAVAVRATLAPPSRVRRRVPRGVSPARVLHCQPAETAGPPSHSRGPRPAAGATRAWPWIRQGRRPPAGCGSRRTSPQQGRRR